MKIALTTICSELNIKKDSDQLYLKDTLEAIYQTYKKPIKHFLDSKASVISAILPGMSINPLRYIQAYETEDHVALYSLLVAPSLGYDFAIKVKKVDALDIDFCVELLKHLATKILSKTITLDLFLGIAVHYLDPEFQTEHMKAVIIVNDPVVQPHESYEYKLIFGIDQKTFDSITDAEGHILLKPWEAFIDPEFEANPEMITTI